MWLFVLIFSLFAVSAEAGETKYEAIVNIGGSSEHVFVKAPNFYTARKQIELLYCGGKSCIVEGPWEVR